MAEIKDDELSLSKQLKGYFTAMQDNLESKQKEQLQGLILEVETLGQKVGSAATKADLEPFQKRLTEIAAQATEMMANQKANQDVIDKFVADYNSKARNNNGEKEPFQDAWQKMTAEIVSKKDQVQQLQKYRDAKMEFELKTSMTTANGIGGTGLGTQSYNPRQGLVPTQQTNMRDLLPTVQSDNGTFITFRETNSLQSFGAQTENSAKSNVLYVFTPGTATLKYIAGFATVTKQLLFNLNFLNGSLSRMLVRDFYKKENNYIYTTMAAAATGSNYWTATADIEEFVAAIANQRSYDFEASWCVINWTEWGRLMVTKPNDYSLPAGTLINNNGTITIAGMPVIGTSYATGDKILLWDRDYVERVEGESLRVEISYENQDNFEKNLVTFRCECFEEINMLRTDALIYKDLGNS